VFAATELADVDVVRGEVVVEVLGVVPDVVVPEVVPDVVPPDVGVVPEAVVPDVVGLRLEAGVVRLVDGVVVLGVVVELEDVGLFAGLVAGLVLERPVLPPPIVPPPVAGSCCAIAMLAQASRHTKAESEIRGSRHRVDMRFSPANSDSVAAAT
jgi:hypothetical protein